MKPGTSFCRAQRGLSLIEVLVALLLLALALLAALQTAGHWTQQTQRTQLHWLARLCAANELAAMQLLPGGPPLGVDRQPCEQAGQRFEMQREVLRTPNPLFRRVDVQVGQDGQSLVRLRTVVGP